MNIFKKAWSCILNKALPEIQVLQQHISSSYDILDRMENRLEDEKNFIEQELEFHKTLLYTVGDTIPDMLWAKDLDGNYMYANEAIKQGLLFDCDPVGKDDVTMAKAAKIRFGDENHTFGEVCGNSDKEVIKSMKSQRFLESGKIKGKMLFLEVHKAPLFINDEVVGVVGTGRDLTEYVESFRNYCKGCDRRKDIFEKYEFKD